MARIAAALRGGGQASDGPEYDIVMDRASKQFEGTPVVTDASFQVKRGEIFGFIGPSGSGKTTTVRMLTGVYTPSEGQLRVLGENPAHFRRRTRERIGYLPQQFALYPNLSAIENMRFVASLYGISPMRRRKRIQESLEFVQLWEARNTLAGDLSGGMQRRLMLASVMTHQPQLIFADEPTAGIDPVLREHFWEEFQQLREQGRTLFVTTQYVTEAEYCDHVALMAEGRIIANDTPEGLRRQAIGGEAIDLRSAGFTPDILQRVQAEEGVNHIEQRAHDDIRVFVDDASTRMAELMNTLQEVNAGITYVEEYRPNFDEVFVLLLEKNSRSPEEVQATERSMETPPGPPFETRELH